MALVMPRRFPLQFSSGGRTDSCSCVPSINFTCQSHSAIQSEILQTESVHFPSHEHHRMQERPGHAQLCDLPTEIIQKIFCFCPDILSVTSLGATSRQFHSAYSASQKLVIIEKVLETQFSPLYDVIQLVTFNSTQAAQFPRNPNMSIALASRIVIAGYVALKWEAIYPTLRWRVETDYRRHLRSHEKVRFRQALYRLWLYGKAFHSPAYLALDRGTPRAGRRDSRLAFMRQFSNNEIVEMAELHDIFHEMVCTDLCPSNAMIQRRFNQGYPGQGLLYFGTYETHPAADQAVIQRSRVPQDSSLPSALVSESWGSFQASNVMVRHVLKLRPNQLLHFRDNLQNRAERVQYLNALPDEFHNEPSTFRDSLEAVMAERDQVLDSSHGIDGGIVDFLEEV